MCGVNMICPLDIGHLKRAQSVGTLGAFIQTARPIAGAA